MKIMMSQKFVVFYEHAFINDFRVSKKEH